MGESDEENENLSSPVLESDDGGIRKEVKKPKKPKRVASRFFNAVLALAFFVLFVLSLVSFSAFSHNYRRIQDQEGISGTCILNADSTTQLGGDGTCRLAIGGEVVIAVYALVSIAVMIIKICGGWSMISCFLIFELIAVIIMILLSFSTCVVISVGRSFACGRLKGDGNCADVFIGNVKFYKDIQVAEVSAWLGFGVLFCITIFYIICVIMYCYGKRQARVARKEAYQRAIDDRKKEEKEEKREKIK